MQVFPADELNFVNSSILDEVVCLPVVRVTEAKKEFLKPVNVEVDYCNKQVNDVDEQFLPIGQTLRFNSKFGVILQSYKESQGQYKWKNVTDGTNSTIQRLQKDHVSITLSVKHFCR